MGWLKSCSESGKGSRASGRLFEHPNIEMSSDRNYCGCREDTSPGSDNHQTRFCHICNVPVLKRFTKDHNQSKLHITLLRLAHEAVERLGKHIQQVTETRDTYYCTPSNEPTEVIEDLEKEINYQALKKREDQMVTLLKMYTEEHGLYTDGTKQYNCTTTIGSCLDKLEESDRTISSRQSPINTSHMSLGLQINCLNDTSKVPQIKQKDKPKKFDNILLTTNSPYSAKKHSFAAQSENKNDVEKKSTEPVNEAFEPESSNHESDFLDITNSIRNKKGCEKRLLRTSLEESVLENDLIEVRIKNGDWLIVPSHNFHGIEVTTTAKTTFNVVGCKLCNKKEMTETSMLIHIKSSMHLSLLQKLVLDYHGIRKIPNLMSNGQSFGHCLVCNLIICSAVQHVASLQHQKRYNKMKISFDNVQNPCINKTTRQLYEKKISDVSQLTAKINHSSKESGSRNAPLSGSEQKKICVDNKNATTTNEKLGSIAQESEVPFSSRKSFLPVHRSDQAHVNHLEEDTILAQDFVEVRTENGVLLRVPRNHYNGIRISSHHIHSPDTSASALRCMLCKERGMTQALVEKHIKSSTHTDFVRRLVVDTYGIRQVANLNFRGLPLGHCVVCNFIVYAEQHVVSLEHQKCYQRMMTTHVNVQKSCKAIDKNNATAKNYRFQYPNKNEMAKHAAHDHQISEECQSRSVYSESKQRNFDADKKIESAEDEDKTGNSASSKKNDVKAHADDKNASTDDEAKAKSSGSSLPLKNPKIDYVKAHADKKKPSTEDEAKTENSASSLPVNNCNKNYVKSQPGAAMAQDLVDIHTENGVLLTVPFNHFNGIRLSWYDINNPEKPAASAFVCVLCQEKGMTTALLESHVRSSRHTHYLQDLRLDKNGIRHASNLTYLGLSFGHCVVCNFIVWAGEEHAASLEHQKQFDKMTKCLTTVQKPCEVDAIDNRSVNAIKQVLQDVSKRDVPELTTSSQHASEESRSRSALQSESDQKNIQVNNKNTSTPNEKLEARIEGCTSSLPANTLNRMNLQSIQKKTLYLVLFFCLLFFIALLQPVIVSLK